MSPKMQTAMEIVSRHLDAIDREVFKPGMKLTFIARDPANPECDFLMSEDDLAEVGEVLIRSSKREDARTAQHSHPAAPSGQGFASPLSSLLVEGSSDLPQPLCKRCGLPQAECDFQRNFPDPEPL